MHKRLTVQNNPFIHKKRSSRHHSHQKSKHASSKLLESNRITTLDETQDIPGKVAAQIMSAAEGALLKIDAQYTFEDQTWNDQSSPRNNTATGYSFLKQLGQYKGSSDDVTFSHPIITCETNDIQITSQQQQQQQLQQKQNQSLKKQVRSIQSFQNAESMIQNTTNTTTETWKYFPAANKSIRSQSLSIAFATPNKRDSQEPLIPPKKRYSIKPVSNTALEEDTNQALQNNQSKNKSAFLQHVFEMPKPQTADILKNRKSIWQQQLQHSSQNRSYNNCNNNNNSTLSFLDSNKSISATESMTLVSSGGSRRCSVIVKRSCPPTDAGALGLQQDASCLWVKPFQLNSNLSEPMTLIPGETNSESTSMRIIRSTASERRNQASNSAKSSGSQQQQQLQHYQRIEFDDKFGVRTSGSSNSGCSTSNNSTNALNSSNSCISNSRTTSNSRALRVPCTPLHLLIANDKQQQQQQQLHNISQIGDPQSSTTIIPSQGITNSMHASHITPFHALMKTESMIVQSLQPSHLNNNSSTQKEEQSQSQSKVTRVNAKAFTMAMRNRDMNENSDLIGRSRYESSSMNGGSQKKQQRNPGLLDYNSGSIGSSHNRIYKEENGNEMSTIEIVHGILSAAEEKENANDKLVHGIESTISTASSDLFINKRMFQSKNKFRVLFNSKKQQSSIAAFDISGNSSTIDGVFPSNPLANHLEVFALNQGVGRPRASSQSFALKYVKKQQQQQQQQQQQLGQLMGLNAFGLKDSGNTVPIFSPRKTQSFIHQIQIL